MLKLNARILAVTAVLLLSLSLLYVATPLLRPSLAFGNPRTIAGQGLPSGGQGGGFQVITPGDQGIIVQGQGGYMQDFSSQGQSNPNFTQRQFSGVRPGSLLSFGLLNGTNGIIFYGIALLVSLIAAVGMLQTKNWGRVLGIVMGAIYSVLALFSFVPLLLIRLMARGSVIRVGGSISIWLNVAQLVLALAVLVLAAVSAKKVASPVATSPDVIPAN